MLSYLVNRLSYKCKLMLIRSLLDFLFHSIVFQRFRFLTIYGIFKNHQYLKFDLKIQIDSEYSPEAYIVLTSALTVTDQFKPCVTQTSVAAWCVLTLCITGTYATKQAFITICKQQTGGIILSIQNLFLVLKLLLTKPLHLIKDSAMLFVPILNYMY